MNGSAETHFAPRTSLASLKLLEGKSSKSVFEASSNPLSVPASGRAGAHC